MATPDRDSVYTNDENRTVYTRERSGTGWFVGIIVVLALLAIGYLVFSANYGPATPVTTTAPAVESTTPAPAPMTDAAPMTEAPATAPAATPAAPATAPAMTPAPATDTAPAAVPAQ